MKPPDALPDTLAVLRWAILTGALLSRGARGGLSLASPFPPPPDVEAALQRVARPLGSALATLGIESREVCT